MTIDKHIKLIGILHIAHSVLVGVVGLFVFGVLSLIGAVSGDETAMFVLGLIGSIVGFFFVLVALPGLVGGIGLLMKTSWGRILTLIVSFLKLLDIPIGTALGVYSIVILFRDDAPVYLAEQEMARRATKP
jgi:hypothetical protein